VGRVRILSWVGLAAALLSFVQARAEECQLKLEASVNVQRMADGLILVPVAIEDQPFHLMLNTGSVITSTLSESVATSLHLGIFPMREQIFDSAGHVINHGANVKDFTLGRIHMDRTQFIVSPWFQSSNSDIAGTLGPELIRRFDLDIDPAANKMQLFSQDHCPGKVVYWTKDWTDAPIKLLRSGHVAIDVELDGKPVTALLDTGFVRTVLSMTAARRLFGLDQNSPKLVETENNGPNAKSVFHYRFDKLSFAGIAINHPDVVLLQDKISKPLTQGCSTLLKFRTGRWSGMHKHTILSRTLM